MEFEKPGGNARLFCLLEWHSSHVDDLAIRAARVAGKLGTLLVRGAEIGQSTQFARWIMCSNIEATA